MTYSPRFFDRRRRVSSSSSSSSSSSTSSCAAPVVDATSALSPQHTCGEEARTSLGPGSSHFLLQQLTRLLLLSKLAAFAGQHYVFPSSSVGAGAARSESGAEGVVRRAAAMGALSAHHSLGNASVVVIAITVGIVVVIVIVNGGDRCSLRLRRLLLGALRLGSSLGCALFPPLSSDLLHQLHPRGKVSGRPGLSPGRHIACCPRVRTRRVSISSL